MTCPACLRAAEGAHRCSHGRNCRRVWTAHGLDVECVACAVSSSVRTHVDALLAFSEARSLVNVHAVGVA